MNWRDLSIKWKLAIPLGGISLLLIALSIQQIYMMKSVTTDFTSIYENYLPAIDMTLNADRDLYQAQIAERTMAMGRFNQENLQSYNDNIQQVHDRLSKVLSLNVNSSIKTDVQSFLQAHEAWKNSSNSLIRQVQNNSIDIATASQMSQGSLETEFEAMRDILDRIGESLSATASQHALDVESQSDHSRTVLIALSALLIVICACVIHFFPNLITSSILRLQTALNEIANGKGDLRTRLPDIGKDEIGKVCQTFNHFLDTLQDLIKNVGLTTVEVNQYSDDMDSTVSENTESMNELTSAIQMVSTSISQMESAIAEVSQNTQQVSIETTKADSESKNAASIFRETIEDINGLNQHVVHSVSDIQKLESEAQGIASVLDVIKGIAEQTNLLALNAAIEAARAGEQGRGFAVVADEVRTLASKTQESTADINQMIQRLQAGVTTVVNSMDLVRNKADETIRSANLAQNSLSVVNDNLGSMNSRIIQVAAAIEEQSSVVEHINSNITQINDLSESLGIKFITVASVCLDLKKESDQLQDQVSNFIV